MYSDTWFPERLVSDRWVNSRLSMRLNCGAGRVAGRMMSREEAIREEDEQGGGRAGVLCPYLVGRHLSHRAPRLQCLQLLQAPVQLLQRLLCQLQPSVLWRPGMSGRDPQWRAYATQSPHSNP